MLRRRRSADHSPVMALASGALVAADVPPCCVPACSLMNHPWLGEPPNESRAKRPSLSTEVSCCHLPNHVHAMSAFCVCLHGVHMHEVESAELMGCGKWS